jgi:hypothetical protein
MSSESVCQVVRSWLEVDSYLKRLFGVVYVTCGEFNDGLEKGTASVHQNLCQSREKCYGDPLGDSTSLRGPNLESCAGVSVACPVKTVRTSVGDDKHTERLTSCTTPESVV